MTGEYSVFLTSAGVASALNVMSSLRLQKDRPVRIVAGDMDPLAPGIHLADRGFVLPPIKDPSYLSFIVSAMASEGTSSLFPMFSSEIELVSENAAALKKEGLRFLVPTPDVVKRCNEKVLFSSFLEENGLPTPRMLGPDAQPPFFVKRTKGSSSKGAKVVRDRRELDLLDLSSTIVQEYIEGREVTIDFLASQDSELLAAVPRERIEVKDGKAVKSRTVEDPKAIDLLREVVSALGFSGPGNLQVMVRDDDRYIIELNPRFAAGGLPLATAAGPNIPMMLLTMLHEGSVRPHMEYRKGLYMVRFLTEIFLKEGGNGLQIDI